MNSGPSTPTIDSCCLPGSDKCVAPDIDYFDQESTKPESPGPSGPSIDESDTDKRLAMQVGTTSVSSLQDVGDFGLVSVSTAFRPGSISSGDPAPFDTVVLSSDRVFFGVHGIRLNAASTNGFCFRLPPCTERRRTASEKRASYILRLPEDSVVLNVMLHAIYGLSCAQYSPSLAVLAAAIAALKVYAVPLAPYFARNTPLYSVILAHAPLPGRASEAFALAAENQLEDLAVAISPYVLPLELAAIPDALARRIGGVYIKRLYALRQRRRSAMRALMTTPLSPHAPNRHCTLADRHSAVRAWLLAAAQLVWEFTPDMSSHSVRAILGSLNMYVSCPACAESLVQRTNEVLVEWAQLDCTI